MSSDEIINEHLNAAIESLSNAMEEVLGMPFEVSKELYNLGLLGRSIGLIGEFQAPIFMRNPELKPPLPEDYVADRKMNQHEELAALALSSEKLQEIDLALISCASSRYSKVAALVSQIISNKLVHVDGLPDVFYSRRIRHLVENGFLESQGNLEIMRYSEVRLPKSKAY